MNYKNRPALGLTVRELATTNNKCLLVSEGVIFQRSLLPYFVPHLCTIINDYESYIAADCHTSIRLANPQEIHDYLTQNIQQK
jgi:hypothetical protein